jgi:hypothetical protein
VRARVLSRFTAPADVVLAARVLGWAMILPVLKHFVPVRSLAGMMRRTPGTAPRDGEREERIVTFARWAARLMRWNSGGNCLERGLIAYRYLSAAGANPTLVVGLGRAGRGDIIGHAWVLVDGKPAGEPLSSISEYTPVFAFDGDGRLLDAPTAIATPDVRAS